MTSKIALLMFATIVLLTSTAIMIVPQASALTPATVINYDARAGHGSNICGDHKCAPGELTQWFNAVWQSQKQGTGKVPKGTHGEDVMAQIAVSTSAPAKTP